jgi:hypothetical protein
MMDVFMKPVYVCIYPYVLQAHQNKHPYLCGRFALCKSYQRTRLLVHAT